MADGAVSWWEIDVPDIQKGTAFYSAITNWKLAPMEGYEGYVIATLGESGIGALQASQDPDPAGRGTRIYIEVSDLEDTLAKVRQAGGTVQQERMEIPGGGWIGTGLDPFGNRIGFLTTNAAK